MLVLVLVLDSKVLVLVLDSKADDIVLAAPTASAMCKMLSLCESFAARFVLVLVLVLDSKVY